MKRLSTSVDWTNISIHNTETIKHLIVEQDDFEHRHAKGFEFRQCITLPMKNGDECLKTLNYNLKVDKLGNELLSNSLIQLSGVEANQVDWMHFVKVNKVLEEGRITRLDLALDVDFGIGESAALEKNETMQKLIRALGFNIKTGVVDEAKSKLREGIDLDGKVSKKIDKISMTASNGITLYIGSRSSKFMIRVYDKTAEVNAKVDERDRIDDQILRFELELKQELATTVGNTLINRFEKLENVTSDALFEIWCTLVNSRLRFAFRNGTKTLIDYLDLGVDAKMVAFDEVRFDTKKLEKFKWLKSQVAPSISRCIKDWYVPKSKADFDNAVLQLMTELGITYQNVEADESDNEHP